VTLHLSVCWHLAVERRLMRDVTAPRLQTVAPPGFCNRGEVRYGSIGGREYDVPQSRLYCLCINVALCSTALQCICRVIRRSSMTMKAHTYYIIFGRPLIGESFPPFPPGGAQATDKTALLTTESLSFRRASDAQTERMRLPNETRSSVTSSLSLSLSLSHDDRLVLR